MSLEETLASLDEAGREEVLSAIEAEKQKGIDSSRSANANEIKIKSQLAKLGYDSSKFSTFEEFESSLTSKVKVADESVVTLASISEKLAAVEGKLTASEEVSLGKTKKVSDKSIYSVLNEAIGEKMYASNHILKAEIGRFKYDEDSDSVTPLEGTMKDALQSILDDNKPNWKVEQTSGNGETHTKSSPQGEKNFAKKLKERMDG